jgi:hypothetical protein
MSDKIAAQIEQESGRKLTNRQREFAKYYVEGRYSNAECELSGPLIGAYFYSRAVVRVLWRLRAYVREPFFRVPTSVREALDAVRGACLEHLAGVLRPCGPAPS